MPAPASLLAPDGGKKRTRGGASGAAADAGTVIGSVNPRARRQARGGEAPVEGIDAVLRLAPLGVGASSAGPGAGPVTQSQPLASNMALIPAPEPAANAGEGSGSAAVAAAVTAPSSLQQLRTTHMTAYERFHATIKLRSAVFERLEKQGGWLPCFF